MLKNASFFSLFFWNVFIAGMWHLVTFLACRRLPDSMLNPEKSRYHARPWERDGRWYRDNLKIQLWKDRLPQHVGKGGFSKQHFAGDSVEYLDQFIRETCRGEWMHTKNLFSALLVLLIDPPIVGLLVSFYVLIADLPFAIVQRYNRFRLLALKKRRIRGTAGAGQMEQNAVTA
jgi:glycosyl-4,4'-diaponeurosporenoate acyltransferase